MRLFLYIITTVRIIYSIPTTNISIYNPLFIRPSDSSIQMRISKIEFTSMIVCFSIFSFLNIFTI